MPPLKRLNDMNRGSSAAMYKNPVSGLNNFYGLIGTDIFLSIHFLQSDIFSWQS
jgi:hypothetical protein